MWVMQISEAVTSHPADNLLFDLNKYTQPHSIIL